MAGRDSVSFRVGNKRSWGTGAGKDDSLVGRRKKHSLLTICFSLEEGPLAGPVKSASSKSATAKTRHRFRDTEKRDSPKTRH